MKYVVVNWTATNETSVIEESCVRDTTMLTKPRKKGMIYYKEIGKKAPKTGLKAYVGRVVSVHDTIKEARKSETEFLLEDKENFESLQQLPVSNSKRRRRNTSLTMTSSEESNHSDCEVEEADSALEKTTDDRTMTVKEKRKMAEKLAAEKLIDVDDSQRKVEDHDLKDFSRDQLIREIKRLQQELCEEKARRNLQDELPGLLIEALSNPKVIEKLKHPSSRETQSRKPLKLENRISSIVNRPRKENVSITSTGQHHTPPAIKSTPRTSTGQPDTSPTSKSSSNNSLVIKTTPKTTTSSGQPDCLQSTEPFPDDSLIKSTPQTLTGQLNSLPPTKSDLNSHAQIMTTPKSSKTPSLSTSPASATPATSTVTPVSAPIENMTEFHKNQVHELLTPNASAEVERSKNFSKMTKTLLTAIFGREVLVKSSLTGKNKDGETALDSNKVEMIIAYVMQSFPFATRTAIRLAISQKIKDERRACERKQITETNE